MKTPAKKAAKRPLSAAEVSRKGALGWTLSHDTGRADTKLKRFSWEREPEPSAGGVE